MKQSDGWSEPYTVSLAISKSCLKQPNVFGKSIKMFDKHFTYTTNVQFFQFFYCKMKAVLIAVTLSKSKLMFRENSIKINIHFIKHIFFINFGENMKDTNGAIIFDIRFVLLLMN